MTTAVQRAGDGGIVFHAQRYVERLPISSLKPHPANPRDHDLGLLHELLDANGFAGAVLVQEKNTDGDDRMVLIAGHGRVKTLIQKGATTVPALLVTVSDEQALRMLLGDNASSDAASNNERVLADVLSAIRRHTGTLSGTGHSDESLTDLLARLHAHELKTSAEDELEAGEKNGQPPTTRDLPLDVIFCFMPSSYEVLIAKRAGWKAGCISSFPVIMKPEMFHRGIELTFIDNEWKNYDHAKHLDAVALHKPKYCTTRDVMTTDQCAEAGAKFMPLDDILKQAEELSAYAENVIVIPKYDCLSDIPAKFTLGYSVQSSYGATPLPAELFRGRRVHLLGGKWDRQLAYLRILKDDVVSLDNNNITNIARFGNYVLPDGSVGNLTRTLNITETNAPRAAALALSLGHIGYAIWQMYGKEKGEPVSGEGLAESEPFETAALEAGSSH